MRICCISDLHGLLPPVAECDLLLLAGDYCPHTKGQNWWLRDFFAPWVAEIAERGTKVVGVAGNHDFIWEKSPDLVPRINWTYLQDSGCMFAGQNIYGSPWQPRFCDWAFNLDEPDLAKKWADIPRDTDILLLHGPPFGAGDKTNRAERIGSKSLRQRIEEVQPKLVVCGHNHGGYGEHWIGKTLVLNVALLDDAYRQARGPTYIDWPIKAVDAPNAFLSVGGAV